MSFEVVHTSVARGLRGESGFATAIMTRGLPAGLESGLQDISGYDHDNVRAVGVDAVEWAHRIVTVRGRPYTVLSRIAPNGIDASRRPNRIAHHLVVEPHERTLGGPAWMLGKFGAFETGSPEVAERAMAPQLPLGDLAVQSTRAWEAAGFDAGWAGVIAQTIIDAPQSTLYVVMPEAIEALPLVIHVLALLPAERRWHVTFSTRPLVISPHVRCQLRFVRRDAPGIARMLAEPGVRVVRVEHDADAGESDAAIAARRGEQVESSIRAVQTKVHPVLENATPMRYRQDSQMSAAGAASCEDAMRDSDRSSAQMAAAAPPIRAIHNVLMTRDQKNLGSDAVGVSRARDQTQWPTLAIALVIYSGLASLGAVILFLLAAFDR